MFSYDEIQNALGLTPASKQGQDGPAPTAYQIRSSFKKMLPIIYKKSMVPSLTKKEQRAKVLELLEWFATKNGLMVEKRHPIQYWMDKQKHDGRIEMVVLDKARLPILAIEVRWGLDRTVGHKLQAAYATGFKPLLVLLDKVSEQSIAEFSAGFKVHEKSPAWLCCTSCP